jgi:hypothetical protein
MLAPNYYFRPFAQNISAFPVLDWSDINDNPEEVLNLTWEESPPYLAQIKDTFHQLGLIETSHQFWILIIDMISFVLLMIFWGNWISADGNLIQEGGGHTFQIDASYVLVTFIHMILTIAMLWIQKSSRCPFMFLVSGVWFAYTYCLTFFYIPSQNRNSGPSLHIYFFFRCLATLLVTHRSVVGKDV